MWFAEDVGSASGKTRKLALPQPSAVSSTLQHRSRAASSLPPSAPVWRRRTEGCPRVRSARTAHGCRLAARRRITRTHRRTRRLHVLVRCSGSGRRTTRSARSTTRPDRSGSRREPRVAKTSSAVGPFAENWACSSAARPSASRTRIAASPARLEPDLDLPLVVQDRSNPSHDINERRAEVSHGDVPALAYGSNR